MDFKELVNLVIKNKILLTSMAILGLVAGLLISFYAPMKWTASQTYLVEKKSTPISQQYFNYDSYYANQVGIAYTNNLASILEGRDLKVAVLTSIDGTVTDRAIQDLTKYLKVKKLGPQLVQVTYQNYSPDRTVKTLDKASEFATEIIKQSNESSGIDLTITRVSKDSKVIQSYINPLLAGLVGAAIAKISTLTYLILRKSLE